MTKSEATAEVFYTAFKALSKKDRDALIFRLVEDEELREDLMDIAVAKERLKEPTRPLREVISEMKKTKR